MLLVLLIVGIIVVIMTWVIATRTPKNWSEQRRRNWELYGCQKRLRA